MPVLQLLRNSVVHFPAKSLFMPVKFMALEAIHDCCLSAETLTESSCLVLQLKIQLMGKTGSKYVPSLASWLATSQPLAQTTGLYYRHLATYSYKRDSL